MLIDISNQFEISLDTLIKEDPKMVKTSDKEKVLGKIKKENIIQKSKKKFEKTKKQFKISLFSEQQSKNCGISDGCSLAYPAGMS